MKDKQSLYKYFIFFLSLYVLIELSLEFILEFPPKLLQIVTVIDFFICLIFLGDWLYFFIKAEKKGRYFLYHIFDLVSAIPFIPSLRFLRVFRIFRFLRGFRGIVGLFKAFQKKPMESALAFYMICLLIIFGYCSLAYNRYEVGVNPGLHSFGDAIWLAFTTLTTIGYGDVHPVTSDGRIVSAILVITGTGFFALLSGEFATLLIKATKKKEPEKD
ncbi:MAG: ion transporter [Candidatus Syntrophosphaera sp.]|nr:ion transporter [Candidatus Syntrophosphaera sp.]